MAEEFKGRNQDRQEFKVVGQRGIPGRQSYVLATGVAKFNRDIVVPNMLFANVLRSPYAHARIKSLDISQAQALPGVKAVITWEDPEIQAMPSINGLGFGKLPVGAPALGNIADREGDEVGVIVAAESEELCEEALKLVKVEWEVLPHLLDPREAVKPDAPILNPDIDAKTNVSSVSNWEDGNVEAGFKEADKIVEYELSFARQAHLYPNPTTAVAWWEQDPNGSEGKTVTIDTPMHIQNIGPQYSVMRAMNLPEDKVHAATAFWGGKYCGYTIKRAEMLTPLLAKRTGRPVRFAESRRDDVELGATQAYDRVKIGFKNDGTLTAAHGQLLGDYGVRGGSGLYDSPTMACFRATKCPNIKQESKIVYTNSARGGAVAPSASSSDLLSKALFVIADTLGMDPTEVAIKNCHTPEPSLKLTIEKGKEAIGWQWHPAGAKKLPNGKMHGYGYRFNVVGTHAHVTYTCAVSIKLDGKVYMPYHEAICGTYWADAVAMVIAEELGSKLEDVNVQYVPNMSMWFQGTATDRGPGATWAAKEAAIDLKAKLLNLAAASLKVKPEELDTQDSTVYLKADPSKSYPFTQFAASSGQLSACFTGAYPTYLAPEILTMNSIFCEVEVDTETGEVNVTKWVAAVDGGKIIRPSSFEAQIENPLIFTTGSAKTEQHIFDKATGVRLNASALEYKPLTRLDVPPIIMPTVETRNGRGCYGASGHSHSVYDRTVVSLAVYNAIGKWIDLPITPDKVLAALGVI